MIFARPPVPGRAKTRLIPLLGRAGAAEFQAALIQDTARKAGVLVSGFRRLAAYLYLPPPAAGLGERFPNFTVRLQRGRDLGARLDAAFGSLLRRHASVVVIGTDSPLLTPRVLRLALQELRVCDAVLGPCPDGGYYLVGLRARPGKTGGALGSRGVFHSVRWGTAWAFRDTLRNLAQRSLSCSVLEPVGDVDRPGDWRRLARELARSPAARRLAPATWHFVTGVAGFKYRSAREVP